MPTLITQRTKKDKRVVPPCGRIIRYIEPHSPFQKLVEARRREIGLSGRALAKQLHISQSTLWIWMHNENGYPHPKSFKPRDLAALATQLGLDITALRTALDASRHLYTPTEHPMPHATVDSFKAFIEILERDPRERLSLTY